MAGFQGQVNVDPAPAIEGDFASANPRGNMLAGPGALVAGPLGVTVGKFARARNDNGQVGNAAPGVASRLGFVHSNQPVFITAWLGASSMLVTPGLEVTLFDSGDFWCRFAAGAAIGQKVYANYADGSAVAAATASPPAAASFTGVIAVTTGVLTASAVTGVIGVGQPISGTNVPAGTIVTGLGTGTGGAGTYTTNINTAVASTAMTTTGAEETRWIVDSAAAAGELAKISTRG